MHHPARQRTGIADPDRMTHARKMVGCRQTARPRPDDQHALARRGRFDRKLPALTSRHVAKETLDGMD